MSYAPKPTPQFIHVSSTATDSDDDDDGDYYYYGDDDDGVTTGENTVASDFRHRIDHPVVDERLNGLNPLEQSSRYSSLTFTTIRGLS